MDARLAGSLRKEDRVGHSDGVDAQLLLAFLAFGGFHQPV